MSLLFICGMYPQKRYKEIVEKSKNSVQFSAEILQRKLLDGLNHNTDFDVKTVSLPYINKYPYGYSDRIIHKWDNENGIEFLGFNNTAGLRNISRTFSLIKYLRKIDLSKIDNVLIYAVHSPFLFAAKYLKSKTHGNIKIVLIVPDLPLYMEFIKYNFIKKIAKMADWLLIKFLLKYIDGYVLLTEHMNHIINRSNKPYIVMEAVSDKVQGSDNLQFRKNMEPYILYSGSIELEYGIGNLIDAFEKIDDCEIKLYICGKGNAEEYVRMKANKNHRILYFGQVEPEFAKKLEFSAKVLVNPRMALSEYIYYSFPSKNMQYLATGNPVVCYMLPGIPDEYREYCFVPMDDTIEALADTINKVLKLNNDELLKRAVTQLDFCRKKGKNESAKRILDMFNAIKINPDYNF